MNIIDEKVKEINNIIDEIESHHEIIGSIFRGGLFLTLRTLMQIDDIMKEKDEVDLTELDISEKIIFVSNIVGLDLKQLVYDAIQERNSEMNNLNETKVADKETLDFITSGLDDYEKFLAENKAKDTLKELENSLK